MSSTTNWYSYLGPSSQLIGALRKTNRKMCLITNNSSRYLQNVKIYSVESKMANGVRIKIVRLNRNNSAVYYLIVPKLHKLAHWCRTID